MTLYATLAKLTPEGEKTLKEEPKRAEEIYRWITEAGGKVIGAWVMTGRYNYLWVVEFPDNKAGLIVAARVEMMGHATMETVEIVPLNEWFEVLKAA